MAKVVPFKAIRPAKNKVHLVASRSVDTYKPHELNSKLAENPYTFLHVIKPEFGVTTKSRPNSPELLHKIKNRFKSYLAEEIFITEAEKAFYIYTQIKDGHSSTGIIGCASIDDYFNEIIRVHEQTITEREEKLMHYLEICDFNAEPVLFSYPNVSAIDDLTKKITTTEPVYDFTTTDKVRHKVWIVKSKAEIQIIEKGFEKTEKIYIADGHHRSASSALLGKRRREKEPDFKGDEPYNFYLGAFFPEDQLRIYDFNRVVKDLNGLYEAEFLDLLQSKFDIEEKGETVYKPVKLHNFSLYMGGKSYSLTAKKGTYDDSHPVNVLDAVILTDQILAPILNIIDLKTDKRISFVNGVKGMKEIKNIVDSGKMKAGFGLYPATMKQIRDIADSGNIMPPKTTYVEPKLRSGLLVYSLE